MTIVASALLSPMCRNKDNMKGLYRESANAQKTGTMWFNSVLIFQAAGQVAQFDSLNVPVCCCILLLVTGFFLKCIHGKLVLGLSCSVSCLCWWPVSWSEAILVGCAQDNMGFRTIKCFRSIELVSYCLQRCLFSFFHILVLCDFFMLRHCKAVIHLNFYHSGHRCSKGKHVLILNSPRFLLHLDFPLVLYL